MRFWHVGKPFVAYTQRTAALDDGRPLHAEMGYWRPGPGGRVELVLAHPTGFTELELGTVDGGTLRLVSESVGRTPTAKVVTRLERDLDVGGDELRYRLRMATGGPLFLHLEGTLRRTVP